MLRGFFKRYMPLYDSTPYVWNHDGLIHCMEGRRGRGKSYCLTHLTLWAMANKLPILTNANSINYYQLALRLCRKGYYRSLREAYTWMKGNVKFVSEWDDILLSHDGVLILDECTRIFNGRSGFSEQRTPPIIYDWLQQCRKVRMTIWIATHNLHWLDNRITSLIDLFWMVKKTTHKRKKAPDGTPLPTKFYLYGKDSGGAGKVNLLNRQTADFILQVPFERKLAGLYNSWEVIKLVGGTPSWDNMTQLKEKLVEMGIIDPDDAYDKFLKDFDRLTISDLSYNPKEEVFDNIYLN